MICIAFRHLVGYFYTVNSMKKIVFLTSPCNDCIAGNKRTPFWLWNLRMCEIRSVFGDDWSESSSWWSFACSLKISVKYDTTRKLSSFIELNRNDIDDDSTILTSQQEIKEGLVVYTIWFFIDMDNLCYQGKWSTSMVGFPYPRMAMDRENDDRHGL